MFVTKSHAAVPIAIEMLRELGHAVICEIRPSAQFLNDYVGLQPRQGAMDNVVSNVCNASKFSGALHQVAGLGSLQEGKSSLHFGLGLHNRLPAEDHLTRPAYLFRLFLESTS